MTDKLKEALERLRSVYDGMTDEEHRKHFTTPGTPKFARAILSPREVPPRFSLAVQQTTNLAGVFRSWPRIIIEFLPWSRLANSVQASQAGWKLLAIEIASGVAILGR